MSRNAARCQECGKPWGLCECEPRPAGKQAWIDKHMAVARDLARRGDPYVQMEGGQQGGTRSSRSGSPPEPTPKFAVRIERGLVTLRRRSLWCRFGLHRWHLGSDAYDGRVVCVAACSNCGLVELLGEAPQ